MSGESAVDKGETGAQVDYNRTQNGPRPAAPTAGSSRGLADWIGVD